MANSSGNGNQALGAAGEELAVDFLRRQRYVIVTRNFRCKGGEVDVIARDGKTLVFVEVKTRRNLSYGVPQLAVTPFKQRQISKAALTWLAKNKLLDAVARFDVIAVQFKEAGAHQILACVSHAILNDMGIERLRKSVIDELITTDTVLRPAIDGVRITTLSVAGLLGEAIKRIHSNSSVNSLFEFKGGRTS